MKTGTLPRIHPKHGSSRDTPWGSSQNHQGLAVSRSFTVFRMGDATGHKQKPPTKASTGKGGRPGIGLGFQRRPHHESQLTWFRLDIVPKRALSRQTRQWSEGDRTWHCLFDPEWWHKHLVGSGACRCFVRSQARHGW